MLSSSFYLGSLTNSLILGVLSTLLTIALGVPLAFCLARLPIPGKSLLLALASLPLVLPSFVAAYALVLLLGRAGIVTRFLRDIGIPFTSIYGMTGMTIVFAMTLFPFVVFPDPGGVQGGRRLGRGGRAEPRLLALAHLLDRHRADRHAGGAGRRTAGLHRRDRELRRAVRAGRGQADPRGRGLQAVRRRDSAAIPPRPACSACC